MSADLHRGDDPMLAATPDVLARSLAIASGLASYSVDSSDSRGESRRAVGRVRGVVRHNGELPPDTLVRPTHDQTTCREIPDAPLLGTRDGVGDAIAWLIGVANGPPDTASRRVMVTLTDCRIHPRIVRAPQGATVLVRSADAMDSRLRFTDVVADLSGSDDETAAPVPPPRALVPLGDAGAVVPTTAVAAMPGLVEIRDDRHPWVRGWIAVAPHPFVAISDRNGRFAFDGVPVGRYVLVTWHERLGAVATPLIVDRGVESRVTVTLDHAVAGER